ncbi:conjugal transfer protein [Haloarcula nitratireducens]|uniref:Conjugal transfer protein n=1 Tax=Haloarcula nitratireducens TaxID=2487749 RepID=A0AAW4PEV0_9EURY|nr:conjugal transfer protein [Halomicroarcula nitratireducens]MBX0296567.1 conjugal transfer protein [Halomicroarcula nitratireducens]
MAVKREVTTMREYLRVTPTSERLNPERLPQALESLHKLTSTDSTGLADKLNPLHSDTPLRFEFLALSEGKDDPVEFYYGADDHLDTLEKRLRSIYPETFDIERTEVDVASRLVQPVEFDRETFVEHYESGELTYEFGPDEHYELETDDDSQAELTEAESAADGGTVTDLSADHVIEAGDTALELAPPDAILEDEPLTALAKPTMTSEGTILARPATDTVSPLGVRWQGSATRKQDWMTSLSPFTADDVDDSPDAVDQPGGALASLVDDLTEASAPIAFQVVFQQRDSWQGDAELRKEDIIDGRDTWAQRVFGSLFQFDDESDHRSREELSGPQAKRVGAIEAKNPKRSFTANIRALSVPSSDGEREALDKHLQSLAPVFDPLDGPYYEVEAERIRDSGFRAATKERNARAALQRLLDREITTGRGKTRPEFVLSGRELANFVLVPSSEQLTVEGARGTRAEQQSRNPLPRPHQDLMSEFRDGMAIGYALDDTGEAEDEPTQIPPRLLPTHYGRFGTTGSGKSKALINDMLSLYDNTEGPTILIIPKNDDMAQNYMRAHARRFGMTDLEENVVHFPIPDVLPGFSFFDLEPSMESGRRREDAVQRKADHYEEILKLVIGTDRYERATVAPTLIKTLIKALFDEEYGRENGLYRASTDYFAHRQLEHVVDQLWEAGPPNENIGDAPRSSDEEVTRTIRRQLQLDPNTFANVMGGVGNRLAYISQDTHLRQIFNNTENQFDFRDVLDEDTVILFDLGDLRDDAARIMTGVILTNLDAALKDRKQALSQHPDDYVVNLLVDEAASVVVSDIMNDLLEKGRGFRLSVGLSMQFPEQMETEGGRKIYLNALNNIGSSLIGKINVDRELARAMAHEEMDPADFANRIRSLPRGEWIASLPSPTFGETGPYPFSLEPLPIPPGHPESESPLTEREEEQFTETLSSMHEDISDEHGVPAATDASTTRTPTDVHEVLDIGSDDLDVAIAKVVRSLQLREGCREENGWVAVEAVDDELRRLFDDVEPPSYDALADIRERSRYLDTTVDIDADELRIRLTEAGEDVSTPETGSVQAAGGSAHDAALLQIEEELTALGFTVSILAQDGSEKPDARASHPDVDDRFAIEVETTTPENPAKVLTNLRKAQEAGDIPLFVVRPGNDETEWAERVDGILTPPVRTLQNGETRFYTTDSNLTFNGGATEEGGVTAVRPATDDENGTQNIWQRDGDEIVLHDTSGTEHIRLPSLGKLSKDRVPAIYSYDHAADEYIVYEHGEQHIYETKSAFEDDWVRVKKPFIPEAELQTPDYSPTSYAIVILPEEGNPVVYDTDGTYSMDTILDTVTTSEGEETAGQQADHIQQAPQPLIDDIADDPEAVVERFAETHLVEDPQSRVSAGEVYEIYEQWAEAHGIDTDSKPWFGRRLGNYVTFERDTDSENGDSVRYYEGLALKSE